MSKNSKSLSGVAIATGAAIGSAAMTALALFAAWKSKRFPRLMQFASMNLLMIVVLLLS